MRTLNLKKGLDLQLEGGIPAGAQAPVRVNPLSVALFPADFPGFVPKLAVREGDLVGAGQPLCVSKTQPDVAIVAPLAGRVTEVLRGERRRIERIVVTPCAGAPEAVRFATDTAGDPAALRRLMQVSGIWAMMRQRPYDIVPDPEAVPRDIMVTAFDSAPLAGSMADTVNQAWLSSGLKALAGLTPGHVYVAVRPGSKLSFDGAERVEVAGPHPAGLPGVQIANISPVNKGETVWTLDIVTAARLGALLTGGAVDFTADVAVTGWEIAHPYMARTVIGADMASLLADAGVKNDGRNKRYISGNVLTGVKTPADGWLHAPWRQVTVIAEGDDVDEFMGWASLSPDKMSRSRAFISSLMPGKKFRPDARLLGGRRAMILSGQYDAMLPMDILPEYLIKAILARDIDRMEALGIYEVSPEDFALCEYADASKIELQRTVREGLDWLRKELS